MKLYVVTNFLLIQTALGQIFPSASPFLGNGHPELPLQGSNYPPVAPAFQYSQPGSSGQYSQPGSSSQYSQPGSSGQYSQPGSSYQYSPQSGSPAQYSQPGSSVHYSQGGPLAEYSQSAAPVQYSHSAPPTQYSQPGPPGQYSHSNNGQYSQSGPPAANNNSPPKPDQPPTPPKVKTYTANFGPFQFEYSQPMSPSPRPPVPPSPNKIPGETPKPGGSSGPGFMRLLLGSMGIHLGGGGRGRRHGGLKGPKASASTTTVVTNNAPVGPNNPVHVGNHFSAVQDLAAQQHALLSQQSGAVEYSDPPSVHDDKITVLHHHYPPSGTGQPITTLSDVYPASQFTGASAELPPLHFGPAPAASQSATQFFGAAPGAANPFSEFSQPDPLANPEIQHPELPGPISYYESSYPVQGGHAPPPPPPPTTTSTPRAPERKRKKKKNKSAAAVASSSQSNFEKAQPLYEQPSFKFEAQQQQQPSYKEISPQPSYQQSQVVYQHTSTTTQQQSPPPYKHSHGSYTSVQPSHYQQSSQHFEAPFESTKLKNSAASSSVPLRAEKDSDSASSSTEENEDNEYNEDEHDPQSHTVIEKPVVHYIEKPVVRFVEKTVIKTVEKPVIKYIEKPVYRYVERPASNKEHTSKQQAVGTEQKEHKAAASSVVAASESYYSHVDNQHHEPVENVEEFEIGYGGGYVRKNNKPSHIKIIPSKIVVEDNAFKPLVIPKELPAYSPGPQYKAIKTHFYGPTISGQEYSFTEAEKVKVAEAFLS